MGEPSSPEGIKETLRPFLQGLAEEDLEELARAAVVRSFPAGAVICREGEPGDTVYFIIRGHVEVVKRLDDESERYLHGAGPGELLGEMAILQEDAHAATIRATEPTVLVEIGRASFLAVLARSPSLGLRILTRLTRRLREADRQAVTDLRRANEELLRALRRLERIDRTKSDFIQVAAHELRTPVAALMGYAQMMQESPAVKQDPELRPLAEGIIAGTQRLHRVFSSILDLSRVMNEDVRIRRSPVSIAVIFQGIHSEFEKALEVRNLTLEWKGLRKLPFCPADPDLLYKAFYHLVNNAIKYTPDGGRITVTGRVVEVAGMGKCLEVVIEDTGIGIASDDIELIFEKFYRTGEAAFHSSGTTSFKGGGPGLGLAIARGIVLAHGGRIWAESPGYDEERCPGSRFIVRLPLEPET